MPNGSYTWLPVATAVQQLAQRLNDPNMIFWVYAELFTYLQQSLRQYNSMTWQWRSDFAYSDPANIWNSLGLIPNSPRLRTITDSYCYTEMAYMLLEPPPTGATWNGTNQFSLSVFQQALERRRNEIIQIANTNQTLLTAIPLTPGQIRTYLPDSVIDVERVRYIPTIGSPATLYRDDTVAQEWYEAPLYQQAPGTPQTFSLSSEPPLSWNVDVPPALPGTYEAVVLQSGTPFNPTVGPTLLNLPDDFAYVAEWGALADLLGEESESTDRERSDYCLKRYQDGLKLMMKTPWIELGKVNGQAVSCDSIVSLDRYDPNWDSNPTGFGPVIVTGGIDFIGAPVSQGIGITMLANAPILDPTGAFIQVSRSDWDAVLDIAQARSCFKLGGAEFKEALEVEKRGILACSVENVRLKSLGAYSDVLDQRGTAQERDMNRFNSANKK